MYSFADEADIEEVDLTLPSIHRVEYIDPEETLKRNILVAGIKLTEQDRHGHEELNFPLLQALSDAFESDAIDGGITIRWKAGMIFATLPADDESLAALNTMADDYSEHISRILDFDEELVAGISVTRVAKILNISTPKARNHIQEGKIRQIGSMVSDGEGRIPAGVVTALYSVKDTLNLKTLPPKS